MRKNRYTQAVQQITAPEKAVEQVLNTAENLGKKENVIDMKKKIKIAVAASLAVAVTAGAVFGFNLFGNKSSNSFVMTVNAAEISRDNSVSVGINDGGMSIANKENEIEYCIDLPFEVKGEHIKSVTYSVDKDAIAVICRKDMNPVLEGNLISESIDTIFDIDYIEADRKALDEAMEKEYSDTLENPEAMEIMDRYESKKYSSITLNYSNQNPEGCAIGIVGKSGNELTKNHAVIFNTSEDSKVLEQQAELLEQIIGNTVHCVIKFDDGSEQQQDIKIGANVTTFGNAFKEKFAELTEEEKEMKDYTGVFVTYSLI